MQSKHRFSNQSNKDPFAGSVLFGSETTVASQMVPISPAAHQSMSLSPMQRMDGMSSIRQGKQFSSPDLNSSVYTGGRSRSRRPPLSSVLDDKNVHHTNGVNTIGLDDSMCHQQHELFSSTYRGGNNMLDSTSASVLDNSGFDQQQQLYDNNFDRSFNNRSAVKKFSLSSPDFSSPGGLSDYNNNHNNITMLRSPTGHQQNDNDLSGENISTSISATATERSSISSPVLTLGPYIPVMDRMEAAWSSWIIVYGFNSNSHYTRELVLQQFLQYGQVENHVPSGTGNWVFIKYVSPIQAERAAAAKNNTYFNSDTLIAVHVLNFTLAKYMNIQLNREGGMLILGGGGESNIATGVSVGGGLRNRYGGGNNNKDDDVHVSVDRRNNVVDGGLYLQPHRRKSVCQQLMEYFFSY